MQRPLYGRVGYWLRQLSPDTSEGTIAGVLDTMTALGGGTCLCLKVADGLTWQGAIDSTLPVHSVAEIVAIKAQCEARAVAFLPVVVPRGADVAGEAALHASIARACGALMVDLEPYSGFLDGDPDPRVGRRALTMAERAAAAVRYSQLLDAAADDQPELIVQPDPRPDGLAGIDFPQCVAAYDAIAGQHYVGWASVDWTDVAAEVRSFQALAAYGLDLYPTLYGVERTDLALAFWSRVRAQSQGVNIFRFGIMGGTELAAFKAMPAPAVPPDPIGGNGGPDYAKAIADALGFIEAARAVLLEVQCEAPKSGART